MNQACQGAEGKENNYGVSFWDDGNVELETGDDLTVGNEQAVVEWGSGQGLG